MMRDYDMPMAQAVYVSAVPVDLPNVQHNGFVATAPLPTSNAQPHPHNNGYASSNTPIAPIAPPDSVNEGGAREFLSSHKWPLGLQETFIHNLSTIAFRFFICDDSGSMSTADGHKLVTHANNINMR